MVADLILPSSLAAWDPLGGTPEPFMTGHDGVCVHTMAGSFVGTDAYFHQNGWSGTESTVGIAGDGRCKQWVSWTRQADANLEGNPRWLSIECADGGESFPPLSTASDTSPPLTTAQINKIIELCVYWCKKENHRLCPSTWRCHNEGIPARFIANSCERGIGTHYHGIEGRGLKTGCPRWSGARGKICPRWVRHVQVRDIIVPAVAKRLAGVAPTPTGEWDQMVTEAQFKSILQSKTGAFLAQGKTDEGVLRPHVFIVSSDLQSKWWIGGWENVAVADYIDDLIDAGAVSGHRKPHVLDTDFLDQIPELWNPVLGYSFAPKAGGKVGGPPSAPPAG